VSKKDGAKESERSEGNEKPKRVDEDDVERFLTVDPLELEIGVGLVALADPEEGESLLTRVRRVRQEIAADLGIILPKVRIRDNSQLDENQFCVKIRGAAAARDMVYPFKLLAVENEFVTEKIKGLQTKSPLGGGRAYWIERDARAEAEAAGYQILEPAAALEARFAAVARAEAAALLTRDATKLLIDRLRETSPAIVDELIPNVVKIGRIQQILQLLLAEGVSIRPLDLILEAIGDASQRETNPQLILSFVRERLARSITAKYCDEFGYICVAMLDPEAESRLRDAVETTEDGVELTESPSELNALGSAILEAAGELRELGVRPVLLVDRSIRGALRAAFPVGDERFAELTILA
ncbi:MAG: FHIPEP family type III secretion protein, partial [Thermoguttaceae bacterium]|nr:FHIPEP family type III secretion protein [Thermoguttaceae bacterium]